MTKRKSLFCTVLIVALVMVMCTPVFADTGSIIAGSMRKSNTSAESNVVVNLTQIATSATCTITLQEYKNVSWVTAAGVSPTIQTKTIKNGTSILMMNDWNLMKGKNYRLKAICKDTTNGITYTTTGYSRTI